MEGKGRSSLACTPHEVYSGQDPQWGISPAWSSVERLPKLRAMGREFRERERWVCGARLLDYPLAPFQKTPISERPALINQID